jgi:hypothetical protein
VGRIKIMQPHYHEDWNQWPYVTRVGHPNVAAQHPWGYPTIGETDAYRVYGPPPRPKKVNHALHVLLTIVTVGFWVPVWLTVMIVVHTSNSRAEADYWFRIQQYRQWELRQQSVFIPPPRELPQGG